MKKVIFLLVIFLLHYSQINGQIIDVVTGLNNPYGLATHENYLYISEFGDDKISRIDLSDPTPTPSDFLTEIGTPYGLLVHENYLYVADSNPSRLAKADLNSTNPILMDVFLGLRPFNMTVDNNIIYFTAQGRTEIYMLELNVSPLVPTVIVSGMSNPIGIAFYDNHLYVSENGLDKISIIDLNVTNPVAIDFLININRPNAMRIIGNDLYISQTFDGKITKVSLDTGNPVPIDAITGLVTPTQFTLFDNDIYIAEFDANKVSKVESILAIGENAKEETIKIYPNPALEYIIISGLNCNTNYIIRDALGSVVIFNHLSNKEKIDVSMLNSGLYFLQIEKGNNYKFIKE